MKPVRLPIALRPSISSWRSPIPKRCLEKSATPARYFSAATLREALGDYCAGPNHVLPTSRTARFSSPLGVYDFQKRSSVIAVSPAGARTLGAIAAELARGEGSDRPCRVGGIPDEMR